jgi:hypothetical protein
VMQNIFDRRQVRYVIGKFYIFSYILLSWLCISENEHEKDVLIFFALSEVK